jgi:hypothetical protein
MRELALPSAAQTGSDLDRSRQGLIQVSYQPLIDALAVMK